LLGCSTKKAAEFSKVQPCTNVPIHVLYAHCWSLVILLLYGKYICLYHLISEHSSGSTPPSIPGQLLVQMFITKEEEKALGISEHNTVDWRRQNNIPDSGLNWERQEKDLTPFQQLILIVMTKKGQIRRDTRVDITTIVYVAEYARISLNFTDLNILIAIVALVSARQHSHILTTVREPHFTENSSACPLAQARDRYCMSTCHSRQLINQSYCGNRILGFFLLRLNMETSQIPGPQCRVRPQRKKNSN